MRKILVVFLPLLLALGAARLALAFAEEPINFLDPATQAEVPDQEISTIHYDLSYALALAAGFSTSDSVDLMLWNQLVDSEKLGASNEYSICSGEFYPQPDPAVVCAPGVDTSIIAWPFWGKMKDPQSCFTSRFGPYSPFFHFPRLQDVAALQQWAQDDDSELVGYQAYAWGANSLLEATCPYTQTVTISTTIQAGSLQAFAVYLHSLADYYSHRDCMAALQGLAPWGTHTTPLANIPECTYNPSNPQNDDAHGREFGVAFMEDSQRTDQAIQHVYAELVSRSLGGDGEFYPLDLDAVLGGLPDAATLRQGLYNFVHNWDFKPTSPIPPESLFAQNRRDYASQMADAALAVRLAVNRVYLPLLIH